MTGNTAIDALKFTVKSDFRHPLTEWAKGKRLILLTAHRRENLGEPMRHMFVVTAGQRHDEAAVEEAVGPLAGGLRNHGATVAGGAVEEVLRILGEA